MSSRAAAKHQREHMDTMRAQAHEYEYVYVCVCVRERERETVNMHPPEHMASNETSGS